MLTWGEGNGTPLQYSCLENPMDGRAWKAVVHGVAEGQTQLSDFTFTFHFHALEKEMATHSSVLAWRIPGMGGAWWAAVHGVAQSWTQLKWLSSSSRQLFLGIQPRININFYYIPSNEIYASYQYFFYQWKIILIYQLVISFLNSRGESNLIIKKAL